MAATAASWPPLRYEEWRDTCDTLHAHTQLLGKLAVALAPPEPQLQHAALRLTARGWETAPLPAPDASGSLVVVLDLHRHEAVVEHSDGRIRRTPLSPDRAVAEVTRQVLSDIAGLVGPVHIDPATGVLRVRRPDTRRLRPSNSGSGGGTMGHRPRRVHPRLGRRPPRREAAPRRTRLRPLRHSTRVPGLRLGPRARRERPRRPAATYLGVGCERQTWPGQAQRVTFGLEPCRRPTRA